MRTSTSQRVIQVVLIVAAALSLAAVFGPVVLARLGLILALLVAVAVFVVARRQLTAVRDEYADRSVRQFTLHRSARDRADRHHAAAQETLREAFAQHRVAAEQDQQTLVSLRVEMASVIDERVALAAEVAELRARRLGAATDDVAGDVSDDVTVDTGGAALADVHQLPRRGVSGVAKSPAVVPGWDNLEVDVARG